MFIFVSAKFIPTMISKQDIKDVSTQQKKAILNSDSFPRELLGELSYGIKDCALVISGLRRCGKSTLMGQLMKKEKLRESAFYLNFDTPRMYGFTIDDFRLIDEIISEGGFLSLFFDEIQVIDGWEVYVRGKLDEGKNVVVTGSNASMLSRELGTKLTGRHITCELFPFSYTEYCGFKHLDKGYDSTKSYLDEGGMPKFLETGESRILEELVNDILYRDIAVRYGIRDERTLQTALSLLLSNVGSLFSANKLKQQLELKSTTTVSEYLSYFQQSYLMEYVPKFSWSAKVQLANPKKVYCIDNGILANVSNGFSKNDGHKLENAVFITLRQSGRKIYYYRDPAAECDFITTFKGKPERAIQVCYELNSENRAREIAGLSQAMDALDLNEGLIVTFNQEDHILAHGKSIIVLPFHEFN